MRESPWTAKVCAGLSEHGAQVIAIVGHEFQERGIPDRWVHHPYWTGWLEFKGKLTRVEPHQARMIRRMNAIRPNTALIVRQPNRVEDERGTLIFEWDSPLDLLRKLRTQLSKDTAPTSSPKPEVT